MELRAGYKQTEVGIVPEDWDVSRLDALAETSSGTTPARALYDRYYRNGSTAWVKTMDLRNSDVVDTSERVTDLALRETSLRLYPTGTVLVAMYGGFQQIGRTGLLRLPAAVNQAITAIRPTTENLVPEFLLATLNHRVAHWKSVASSSRKDPNISSHDVRSFPIAYPAPPEQRAIAAALSDVDALLDGLTRLIAKKRDLKQAAMQQLLTGRTRLPGFHGEWKVKRLDELGSWRGGMTPSMQNPGYWENGDVPWISSGDVKTVLLEDTAFHVTSLAVDEGATTLVPAGSIVVVTRSGILRKRLPVATNVVPMAINQDIKALIPAMGFSVPFLLHALIGSGDRILARCLKSGTTVESVEFRWLKSFTVELPPTIDEQAAIAAVLSDMDAELSALEARRDKTRALKQAMMEELLTGRTRLVVPAVTESTTDSERTDGRRANIHFKRSVLAAEIIDRLHDEPTFGHVKFEKMIYLVEHLCNVDTGSSYHRDAAGPYDNRAMRSIDSQLRKQKWFDAQKIEGRYQYQPMANRGKHKAYFKRYFSGISPSFDTIIDTFRRLTTKRCEIVATLFSAWSDLLRQKGTISDDTIVNEVLNNWHESKKRIPEDRWRKALSWMRDHGFVPQNATGAV